ncbi:MetQ/NlpA family ABC transporter substrate-binding protein [Enterococcus sp. BWT-B8]|uniref:MetQ/NlpA family ABC transporter substrate-binding protein n=1 Tax=Enterococcus sp. BWT-B8 TaxID=2885157 RepID=UPI001E435881|nr:MetQ/NlpA family ABC transporter substrate-binding protein [Enterococcus sp. BWT-B8]MCB5951628.1 MetQ/NlpA family ABC transporter substrate-binding protein [Enterococcus sp. BWT-B8]
MKKILSISLCLGGLLMLAAGCRNQAEDQLEGNVEKETNIIKVASHMPPMTDVVKIAGEVIEKDGYKIELVQVNDNIQYNELLNDKEIDANFAQHEPFMEKFNQEKNADLVLVQKIYNAKVGFYSRNYTSVEEIPDGAKIALPSDISNEGRALAILDEQGLIQLEEGVGFEGTIKDIRENPKNFEWLSIDLLNLAEAYNEQDVALVYNYPTYIAKVGLTPKDALILEKTIDDRFAISLVAREDNQNSDEIKALKAAMTSDEVKSFLENEHSETLTPAF